MKKDKKFIAGIVLIVIGVIGLLGGDGAAYYITCALFVCGGIALVVLSKKKKSKSEPSKAEILNYPENNKFSDTAVPAAPAVPTAPKSKLTLPIVIDNFVLRYDYENQICFEKDKPRKPVNIDNELEFRQEPENEFDNEAVAIYADNVKIGYVYKGSNKDMINSYIERNKKICAYIFKIEDDKVYYKIGFYDPLKKFADKEIKLTKIKKVDEYTDRRENLSSCEIGDFVIFDRSENKDFETIYIINNKDYDEIGEAPKSFVEYAEERDCKRIVGEITDIQELETENGAPKFEVKIKTYTVV